jgi:hypothetical protein
MWGESASEDEGSAPLQPVPPSSLGKRPVPPSSHDSDSDSEDSDSEDTATDPAAPGPSTPARPQRYNETDAFFDEDEESAVTSVDDDGTVWCTVPGFPTDRVRASSLGFLWLKEKNGVEHTTDGSPRKGDQRRKVTIDGRPYYVYTLVCRAFHGAPPTREHTPDHGRNGVFDEKGVAPDCTDNLELNLRWATKAEQNGNQKDRAPQRNGKPIIVRHLSWGAMTPPMRFGSGTEANKGLGVNNLHAVANGKQTRDGEWTAVWAPPLETQDDLVDAKTGEVERWVRALDTDRVWVSSMGRAWVKDNRGDGWGDKFTPVANDGMVYAVIGIDGVGHKFHRVVFFAFGNELKEGQTVDHGIDGVFGNGGDESNNKLSNLRAATGREQKLSQTLRPATEIMNDRKKPVQALALDAPPGTPWETFPGEGMAGVARQLTARHPERKFDSGSIGAVCRGKGGSTQHHGYRFRFA